MDVGRSTAAHVNRFELHYPHGNELLENWSAWYANGDRAESTIQPMFREYLAGYRETSAGLRSIYDEDSALQADRLFAKHLTREQREVIFLHFVHRQPSRTAARNLAVSVGEYRLRLESVVARVDTLISAGMLEPIA